jgi:hypothetical protein
MVKLTAVAAALVAVSAAVSTPRHAADEAGMVVSADRKAVLMVRRGATPSMRLRIVARREEIPAGAAIVAGSYYEIVPHDVTLRKSAHFRISYHQGTLPDGVAEDRLTLLHYVDGAWTEVPNATLNAAKNHVTANVRRLGGYAVGVVTPLQSASDSLSQS